jgi:HAD superfamily hydrolase (TIGR01509 family)
MIKAIFWDFFGVINIDGKLNPEVAKFIKLNKNKYKFAILSASNIDLRPWLKENGILDLFKLVQITSEVNLTKTDPNFYIKALEKLNVKANEALFVDDIQSYLDVASKLGIKTELYTGQSLVNLL